MLLACWVVSSVNTHQLLGKGIYTRTLIMNMHVSKTARVGVHHVNLRPRLNASEHTRRLRTAAVVCRKQSADLIRGGRGKAWPSVPLARALANS